MDITPLKHYLSAHDAWRAGDYKTALDSLTQALGGVQSSVVQNNLDRFLNPETIAGEVMLQLLVTETKRGEANAA
jgi:hypothetical protein